MSEVTEIVGPSGEHVRAERIAISSVEPNATLLKLDDGTVLELHLIPIGALRILDTWNDNGDPLYNIQHQAVIRTASVPNELRRPEVS